MSESSLMRAIQLSDWDKIEGNRCVYFIMNIMNKRIYIGSTKKLRSRMWRHYSDLLQNKHHCSFLQRDFNLVGEEYFFIGPMEDVPLSQNLISKEQRLIDFYDKQDRLYNVCKVAGSCEGSKRSEEAKLKTSLKNKGSKRTPEQRARVSASKRGIFTSAMRNSVIASSKKRRFNLSKEEAFRYIERNKSGETISSIMKSHGKVTHHPFIRELRKHFPYYRANQRGFQCRKQS